MLHWTDKLDHGQQPSSKTLPPSGDSQSAFFKKQQQLNLTNYTFKTKLAFSDLEVALCLLAVLWAGQK